MGNKVHVAKHHAIGANGKAEKESLPVAEKVESSSEQKADQLGETKGKGKETADKSGSIPSDEKGVADTIIDSMSKPDDDLPADPEPELRAEQPAPAVAAAPSFAFASEIFDPEIHAVDEAGNPKKNQDGSYAKKRGRKKGSTNTATNVSAIPVENQPNPAVLQMAIMATNCTILLGMAIGGDEWIPKREPSIGLDERGLLHKGWSDYLATTDMQAIPSWMGLAIALSAYSLPRVMLPKTKSRIAILWGKMKGFFSRKKAVL